MVILPLTVDKISHNSVLLGYHPDTGGENAPVRHKCKEWLLSVVKLIMMTDFDSKTLSITALQMFKSDFELRVKAEALPSG